MSQDRRQHARLHAHLEVEVLVANERVPVELRDLSQGGACVFTESENMDLGDMIRVVLPGFEGETEVDAEIVRVTELGKGGRLLGCRFGGDEAQLEAVDFLLGMLLTGNGGGGREHPRVAKRISVPCRTQEDLLALVENISLGGLALNVNQELGIGEEILVVLPAEDGEDLLTLQGRVVNQRALSSGDDPQYLVGLAFEGMTAQRRTLLDAMLVSLLRDS